MAKKINPSTYGTILFMLLGTSSCINTHISSINNQIDNQKCITKSQPKTLITPKRRFKLNQHGLFNFNFLHFCDYKVGTSDLKGPNIYWECCFHQIQNFFLLFFFMELEDVEENNCNLDRYLQSRFWVDVFWNFDKVQNCASFVGISFFSTAQKNSHCSHSRGILYTT